MEIKAALVREHRTRKSWTQQHLADACDVSLRTIQRVETLGVAAPETVLSLCAALEVSQDDILEPYSSDGWFLSGPLVLMVLVALVSMALGAGVTYFMMH